jgi:hypothetical protein
MAKPRMDLSAFVGKLLEEQGPPLNFDGGRGNPCQLRVAGCGATERL